MQAYIYICIGVGVEAGASEGNWLKGHGPAGGDSRC